MAARDHLMEDESILSSFPPFYATNRRILRCETTGNHEEVHDLFYHRIESVELVRQPRHGLAIGGVVIAFLGIVIWMMGFITAIPSILLGVGLIFWGARGREGYYQFRGYQMPPDELARWQVRFRGSAGFIMTVSEHVRRPMKWT